MSLPGLPPLPKSLSGVELTQQQLQQQINQSNNYHHAIQQQQSQLNSFDSQRSLTSSSSSSISRKTNSSLDNQLAILRREMVSYGRSLTNFSIWSTMPQVYSDFGASCATAVNITNENVSRGLKVDLISSTSKHGENMRILCGRRSRAVAKCCNLDSHERTDEFWGDFTRSDITARFATLNDDHSGL